MPFVVRTAGLRPAFLNFCLCIYSLVVPCSAGLRQALLNLAFGSTGIPACAPSNDHPLRDAWQICAIVLLVLPLLFVPWASRRLFLNFDDRLRSFAYPNRPNPCYHCTFLYADEHDTMGRDSGKPGTRNRRAHSFNLR